MAGEAMRKRQGIRVSKAVLPWTNGANALTPCAQKEERRGLIRACEDERSAIETRVASGSEKTLTKEVSC